MKELNSSSKTNLAKDLLTYDSDGSKNYSMEQVRVMKELAEKHGLSFTNVSHFLCAIGRYIREHIDEDNILHMRRFGKFIPLIKENGRVKRKRKNPKNRKEENTSEI